MSTKRPRLQWSDGAAGPLLAAEAAIRALFAGEDADSLAWQDSALCAQTDPEAFFPEKGGSARDAKEVCRRCEVRAECLEYALRVDDRFGIYGGLSPQERRRLQRGQEAA